MTPGLSILICTIASRTESLGRLLDRLQGQMVEGVEVLTECDAGEITTGEKRNILIGRGSGDYLCFIDDDDAVAPNYIPAIVSAFSSNPDCVGFKSRRFQDGNLIGDCTYSLRCANKPDTIDDNEKLRHFSRTPCHLTPIRRDHVLATRFMPWCFSEDRDFGNRVLPLLKTEAFIDEYLYDYLLVTRQNRAKETVHPQRWKYERPKPVRAR